MKVYDYVVWQEDKYFVSQCLNVNVSSFGESIDEAIRNLREAVELYFKDETSEMPSINKVLIGRDTVYV